jgi:hypothetical protein
MAPGAVGCACCSVAGAGVLATPRREREGEVGGVQGGGDGCAGRGAGRARLG